MAQELEKFLDRKKFDLVDYSYPAEIIDDRTPRPEIYPPPESDEFPELKKLCKQWLDFFDEIEQPILKAPEDPGDTSLDIMLEKYCPEMVAEYQRLNQLVTETEKGVNTDEKFWEGVRAVILPLYDRSKQAEAWGNRWKAIQLVYDPCPLTVTTTQMWTNKKTGERKRGGVVRETNLPAGFVMKLL